MRTIQQKVVQQIRRWLGPPAIQRHLLIIFLVALGLRVLSMIARGDYVAFDEGYYLLLGENLWNGRGYTLNGLPHTTFSPLYPFLGGLFSQFIEDPLWAGRTVSVLASAFLIIPAFAFFKRLSGRITALAGSWLLAVAPVLMAFVSYWVGRDVYVSGSEPLLHLLLFTALALIGRSWKRAGLAGLLMGLAYLARPEALAIAGVLGLWIVCPTPKERRQAGWKKIRGTLKRGVVFGATLAIVATPYVLYMHQTSGHWTISGRGIPVVSKLQSKNQPGAQQNIDEAQEEVKSTLWGGSEWGRIQRYYSLDPTGLRLSTNYWGHYPERELPAAQDWEKLGPPETIEQPHQNAEPGPSKLTLYGRTLFQWVFPLWAWPLALLGLFVMRRREKMLEGWTMGGMMTVSLAIVVLVHVDVRNHLFLTPLVCLYAGAASLEAGRWLSSKLEDFHQGYFERLCVGLLTLLLALQPLNWARQGLMVGSPHHIVGSENRKVGQQLNQLTDPDEPIMSWHPAIAVFANRDWRVLPYEPLPRVVRYATYRDVRWMVLSVFYPAPVDVESIAHYIAFELPASTTMTDNWQIEWQGAGNEIFRSGRLLPAQEDEQATEDTAR